jgi:hypothetical protein
MPQYYKQHIDEEKASPEGSIIFSEVSDYESPSTFSSCLQWCCTFVAMLYAATTAIAILLIFYTVIHTGVTTEVPPANQHTFQNHASFDDLRDRLKTTKEAWESLRNATNGQARPWGPWR